jgi:hypothetical protein
MKGGVAAVALLATLIGCCVSCAKTTSTDKPALDVTDWAFNMAAADMVARFNHSGKKSGFPVAEIPESFWVPEIAQLEPSKVLWHNNNLALVLGDGTDAVDGLYIHVLFSSYMAMTDTIELEFRGETYTFRVCQ